MGKKQYLCAVNCAIFKNVRIKSKSKKAIMSNQDTVGRAAKRKQSGRSRRRRVVLVGPLEDLSELSVELKRYPKKVVIDGLFSSDASGRVPEGLELKGSCSDLRSYLAEGTAVDDVYFVLGSLGGEETRSLYGLCQQSGMRCLAVPPGVGGLRRRMQASQVGDAVVLSLCREPFSHWYNRLLKRCVDVLLSLLFLLTLFPLIYVVLAVLTKWKRLGSVFRVQKVCGMDGRVVRCLTFRLAASRWLKRTPLVMAVFRGDLSMVGPRPFQPGQEVSYRQAVNRYTERSWTKPGLTGWAQLQGLGDETGEGGRLEARVREDIWYAEHWSLWLDLGILLRAALRK